MVVWLIGLSGAGKTTLSRLIYQRLKPSAPNLVLLDGDVMRELFPDLDHSLEGRRRNAERLSRLSRFLSEQGIHVIAAVLSIFPEWQRWNREHIENYTQVYLRADLARLTARDSKGLYRRAEEGELKNVVGVDLPFPEPYQSDLEIDMTELREKFDEEIERILALPALQALAPGR